MAKAVSAEDLLNDLRKTANKVSGPLSASKYDEFGEFTVHPVVNQFGTWNNGKDAAGLNTTEPGGWTKGDKTRKEIEAEIQQFKDESPCGICNTDRRYPAMDFHHRDPSEKVGCIGNMPREGYSEEEVWDEIEKCEVLCANCHREIEAGIIDEPWTEN